VGAWEGIFLNGEEVTRCRSPGRPSGPYPTGRRAIQGWARGRLRRSVQYAGNSGGGGAGDGLPPLPPLWRLISRLLQERLVERRNCRAARGDAVLADDVIGEVALACGKCSQRAGILGRSREREMLGVEEAPEHCCHLGARKTIPDGQYPDGLAEHDVRDKERGTIGDSLLDEGRRFRGLSRVILDEEANQHGRVERDRPCGWSRSSPPR